jgi:hypothetical protein
MGCRCNKKEIVNFQADEKELKNTERTDQILSRNFGGFKNTVDKKRKIAILKRRQKL